MNRASDPDYRERAANFAEEVARRWDGEALRQNVIATQRARRALHRAMEVVPREGWDYAPRRDATQEYVRNHMDWTVAAARYRFPPFEEDMQ